MAGSATFTALWADAVSNHGDRPFLVFHDDSGSAAHYTYAEFDDIVVDTQAHLATLGVTPGSGIHMCLQNCPGFVAVWLAAARMGAWMIPVDPTSSRRDLENQISRTSPAVGVVGTGRLDDYRAAAPAGMSVIAIDESAADLEIGGSLRPASAHAAQAGHAAQAEVRALDRLGIMFTSGTTSEPKGVVLTQANYAYIARTMAQLASLKASHRWFVTLPLFHGNAQYYCFSAAIAVGASVALTHRFSASRWLEQARELEASHVSLFAAPIRMIIAKTDPNAEPLSLTHVWYAQNLSKGHFSRFTEICGVTPRQLYGMTETTAIVSCDLSDHPSHDTIGRVVPGRRIALVSEDTGRRVQANEPGLLLVAGERGHDLFSEYLDNPAANAKAFSQSDGAQWFSTGDLVWQDTDDQLYFVGRADDVIKVSGENVSLTEVEAALAEAAGVLEIAVVAVPDEIRDVVPAAFVVAEDPDSPPSADTLIRFAEHHLPKAARPRSWEIVDALPKTSVGKVRRFKLGK